MKKKSLGLNGLLNGLRSMLNLIFPLITFPYVTRVLSVNGIGKYNFSNTYVGYFVLIAGLGISTYAVREGAKYRDDRAKISEFVSQVFTINIFSTIIAYLLLAISLILFHNLAQYVACIIIFSLQIFFTTLGTEWIYIIYEEYSYITIRSIIFKVISILLLFVFVKKTADYLNYAAITVFASVGSNLLNFIHAKKFCDIRLSSHISWKYHLKPILVIFATTLAVNIYLSSDTTILGIMKTDYAVGIYSTAVKIYTIVATLLGSVVAVTVPRLSMLMGQYRREEYNNIFSQVINMLNIFVIGGTIGLIMMSREIVMLIAGEKYLASINSLRIIGLAIIFSNFSFIFTNCALIPAKRENAALKNTIITALVNIILNFILIPKFSYDGTAFSTVVAEFMTMIMNYWSARDILRNIVFSKEIFKNLLTSLLGGLGIIVTCVLCKYLFSSLVIKLILAVLLSVIVYMCILIVCKNDYALYYFDRFKDKCWNVVRKKDE